MSQEEMDQCWKKLAENMEEEVLEKYKVTTAKEELTEAEVLCWNGGVCEKTGSTEYESGERIVAQETSLCSENIICSVCKACMRVRRSGKS